MSSATPPRFSVSLGAFLRARPLDEVGRQRVEALLYAGREAAAVNAYREVTHATQRDAVVAVAGIKNRLDALA